MKPANFDCNWGGEGYAAYEGVMSTSTVTPNTPAAPPTTTAPTAATTSAVSTASPAGGSTGVSPTPTHDDANIKQLREGYEKYKSLGDHEALSESHGTYTKLRTEASTLGKALGYSADEVEKAFKTDPVATMYLLRKESKAAEANATRPGTRENVQSIVQKQLDEALRPEREARQRQVAETRMSEFTNETTGFIEKEYPGIGKDAPKAHMLFGEISAALLDRKLNEDPKAMQTFLKGGGQAILKEVHATAKEIFNSALTEFQTWQMKKGGITANSAAASSGAERPKFSLEDVINGDDKATKHLTSMRPR